VQFHYRSVHLVRHKATRKIYAMKKINKKNVIMKKKVKHVYNERDIMGLIQSPLVVNLHCTFQSKVDIIVKYIMYTFCKQLG